MDMPLATYRLQLRNGMTFAAATRMLPWIAGLGVSHLYLSPPFQAVAGSTHGYDITDVTRIDAALGGRAGFDAFAAAARAAGLGIILDIVPNHMAFSVQTPWLACVLRHGRASRFAGHFDIDWEAGPVVLPWLDRPLARAIADGHLRRDGAGLRLGDIALPLAPGSAALTDMDALLAAQAWTLAPHDTPRLSHRRFFTVTGLVGMRVEDPAVFADTHALILDLVAAGQVQGLRVDHVDGLADPAGYLRRLRARLPGTPVWVEKILTGNEALPGWPVQGTTGYEAARALAQVLTDPQGLARLTRAWAAATGDTRPFHAVVAEAKDVMLAEELAPELAQLRALARAACGDDTGVRRLLTGIPRYRTYLTPDHRPAADLALLDRAAGDDPAARRLAAAIARPATPAAHRLQARFQQVTGALLAKAHEDTAGFRHTAYLAACEVGADPGDATMTPQAFTRWISRQSGTGLTLTSSHDTKRAEDARMRLVAISHDPDAFLELWRDLAVPPDVAPALAWYILQSVLAAWQPGRADLPDRIATHVEKAMREAKEATHWLRPDAAAEAAGKRFALGIVAAWNRALPAPARRLIALGERLSLEQLVLKLTMPGIPDIYQGTEVGAFHLTDPDNRAPVDLPAMQAAAGFDAAKLRLTRCLLHLRRSQPRLFAAGTAQLERLADGGLRVRREAAGEGLSVTLPAGARMVRIARAPATAEA